MAVPAWLAIAVSSAAFVALHRAGVNGSVAIGGQALAFSWLAIETGGLEASIALHAVNNLTAFLFLAAFSSPDAWFLQRREPSWTTVSMQVAAAAVYVVAITRLHRRHRRQHRAPTPATAT